MTSIPNLTRRSLVGGAMALTLPCGSARAAEDKIVLGGMGQSLTSIALNVMTDQGIDKKNGFALEYRTFPTLDAVFNAVRGGQVDVAAGGWTATAQFRDKGQPLVMFYPVARGNSLEVLVLKDSSAQTFADLKDKRIGSYAGAAGTATVLMRVIMKNYFGYDPATTGKLQYSGPGLLPALLDKKDLDAVLLCDPGTAIALDTGKYRSIGNLPDMYKKESGEDFFWIGYSTNDTFAKNHPETLKGFTRAWGEAVHYAKAHPEIFDRYVKSMDFKDSVTALLRKRVNDDYTLEWNQGSLDNMQKFATFSRSVMGPGYLDHFKPEAFTLAFAPA
jgi:NitT/TauT family transport system substrate-binding protein